MPGVIGFLAAHCIWNGEVKPVSRILFLFFNMVVFNFVLSVVVNIYVNVFYLIDVEVNVCINYKLIDLDIHDKTIRPCYVGG